jgi:hypothetical protein
VLRATLETPDGVVLQPIEYRSPQQHRRRSSRGIYASCGTCYVVPALGNNLRHWHKAAFNAMLCAGSTLQATEAPPRSCRNGSRTCWRGLLRPGSGRCCSRSRGSGARWFQPSPAGCSSTGWSRCCRRCAPRSSTGRRRSCCCPGRAFTQFVMLGPPERRRCNDGAIASAAG